MPTYQYACTQCDHFFEVFQSFTEDSLTECPECGGKLRKVFNAVGVVFKGSGFYKNDSRSSSSNTGSTKPSPAASSSESSSSSTPAASTSSSDSSSSSSSSSSTSTAAS